MADGTQELETIVGTRDEPRQTCLDERLIDNVRIVLRREDVQPVEDACDVMHLVGSGGLQMRQERK